MKLSIRESYEVLNFTDFEIVIPNLLIAVSPLVHQNQQDKLYAEDNETTKSEDNEDNLNDIVFSLDDFKVTKANRKNVIDFITAKKTELSNNQDKILDDIVIPIIEQGNYTQYNPKRVALPGGNPYNSITVKKDTLGYARYYHYTNDVIGNIDSSIISEFNNFVIRLGNHKSPHEEVKYKNNEEFIVNYIGITEAQKLKIIGCVNNVVKARSLMLDFIKSSDTLITSINDIPENIIQALLKAKKQHIDN